MHIVIVGPGALGCLLAASLRKGSSAKDTISLLDYNAERAALINTQGILYRQGEAETAIPIRAYSDPALIEEADALFLCVKSYDVEKTIGFCRPLLNPETLLIFMQNGIAHLSFDKMAGEAVTVFGTTTEGATNIGPGHVLHAGSGVTYLGFLDKPSAIQEDLLNEITLRLQGGGTVAHCSTNILQRIWNKLFINIGINALTVIHDCRNGELVGNSDARADMEDAIAEAHNVAAAKNIAISLSIDDVLDVCHGTEHNISSMLQDIRKGRQTEIDAINGAIVDFARPLKISVPANASLVRRVKQIELNVLRR